MRRESSLTRAGPAAGTPRAGHRPRRGAARCRCDTRPPRWCRPGTPPPPWPRRRPRSARSIASRPAWGQCCGLRETATLPYLHNPLRPNQLGANAAGSGKRKLSQTCAELRSWAASLPAPGAQDGVAERAQLGVKNRLRIVEDLLEFLPLLGAQNAACMHFDALARVVAAPARRRGPVIPTHKDQDLRGSVDPGGRLSRMREGTDDGEAAHMSTSPPELLSLASSPPRLFAGGADRHISGPVGRGRCSGCTDVLKAWRCESLNGHPPRCMQPATESQVAILVPSNPLRLHQPNPNPNLACSGGKVGGPP